jgi:hypothetical protein
LDLEKKNTNTDPYTFLSTITAFFVQHVQRRDSSYSRKGTAEERGRKGQE